MKRIVRVLPLMAAVWSAWLAWAWPGTAAAGVGLLAPARIVDPSGPLRLTLVVTGDEPSETLRLPETLQVTMTPDLGAPVRVELRRERALPPAMEMGRGEFLRVDYVGEVPARLRGRVRIDAVDLDAAPMFVQLSVPRAPAEAGASDPRPAAAPAAATDADRAAPAVPAGAPTAVTVRTDADPNRRDEGRLTFHDPMFFVLGAGADANARLQLSFKLRLHEPADKLSRRLLDNLYVSYTQLALWDLTAESKPFLDINHIPSVFYETPATDWVVAGHAVGFAAGFTHESNGRDGDASRSIDLLFVRPRFLFGDPTGFHWTFAPKLYGYVERSSNPDITHYRGYGDYRLTYGRDNDWQLASTLRVGTRSGAFSADLHATYPLHRFAPGLAGYLMGQFFTGYGESLLTYDRREPWALRVGYAISR